MKEHKQTHTWVTLGAWSSGRRQNWAQGGLAVGSGICFSSQKTLWKITKQTYQDFMLITKDNGIFPVLSAKMEFINFLRQFSFHSPNASTWQSAIQPQKVAMLYHIHIDIVRILITLLNGTIYICYVMNLSAFKKCRNGTVDSFRTRGRGSSCLHKLHPLSQLDTGAQWRQ